MKNARSAYTVVSNRLAEQMTEKAFQQLVVDYAGPHGWSHYHTHRSDRSVAGFPDLILTRGPRIVAAELKVGSNVTTDAQFEWLERFRDCGAEAVVWRPTGRPAMERWPAVETIDEPYFYAADGSDSQDFGAIGQRLIHVSADRDLQIRQNVLRAAGMLKS